MSQCNYGVNFLYKLKFLKYFNPTNKINFKKAQEIMSNMKNISIFNCISNQKKINILKKEKNI